MAAKKPAAKKKAAPRKTTAKKAAARRPRGYRSETLKTRHQAIIARDYLRGRYQAEIAKDLGIGVATVKRDLIEIRSAWRDSALRDFDDLQGEQLARIDEIEAEAWSMWLRSKEKHVKVLREDIKATQWGGRNKKVTSEQQAGDPRYLAVLLNCVERRSKILGLDAPQKIAPTNPAGDEPYQAALDMTTEERQARIRELTAKLAK